MSNESVILAGERVAKYLEAYVKVGPNGVDVAPKKVFKLPKRGVAFLDDNKRGFLIKGRFVPLRNVLKEIKPANGFWELGPGFYYAVFPRIKIPSGIVGFAFPRSTLNRLGIFKAETAVFDSGYEGEWNQTFWFPRRARIATGEGWVQVVFLEAETGGKLYNGHWQGEEY